MAITTVNLSDPVSTWVTKTNTISTDLGDVDSLNTSAIDLVQAINNLESRVYRFDDSAEIIALAREATGIELPFNVNNDSASGLSLAYDSTDGTLSLIGGADAATVRSYLVAGEGLDYDSASGVFSMADSSVTQAKMAQDAVSSTELKDVVSLIIYNSAGTPVKTIYGAGS
jgi:hypothetical protein